MNRGWQRKSGMPSRRRVQLALAVAALALGVLGAEHDVRDARELKHCDPGDEDCGGKSGGKSKGQGNGQGPPKGLKPDGTPKGQRPDGPPKGLKPDGTPKGQKPDGAKGQKDYWVEQGDGSWINSATGEVWAAEKDGAKAPASGEWRKEGWAKEGDSPPAAESGSGEAGGDGVPDGRPGGGPGGKAGGKAGGKMAGGMGGGRPNGGKAGGKWDGGRGDGDDDLPVVLDGGRPRPRAFAAGATPAPPPALVELQPGALAQTAGAAC